MFIKGNVLRIFQNWKFFIKKAIEKGQPVFSILGT